LIERKLQAVAESLGITLIEKLDMEKLQDFNWDYGFYYEQKNGLRYVFEKVRNKEILTLG